MTKSDLRNLIKNTIKEILKEKTINVVNKKDIPKDLERNDVVNIGIDVDDLSYKLQNVDKNLKSKPVKMTKDFYA